MVPFVCLKKKALNGSTRKIYNTLGPSRKLGEVNLKYLRKSKLWYSIHDGLQICQVSAHMFSVHTGELDFLCPSPPSHWLIRFYVSNQVHTSELDCMYPTIFVSPFFCTLIRLNIFFSFTRLPMPWVDQQHLHWYHGEKPKYFLISCYYTFQNYS